MKRNSTGKQKPTDIIRGENLRARAGATMDISPDEAPIVSLRDKIRQRKIEVERSVLIQTLRKTGGNKAEAARLLQINYSTIHLKIKRYGIR